MPQPRIGVALDLHIDVRTTKAGGRQTPIVDGYRPLCIIDGPNGQTIVGLCELRLHKPISPGEAGVGRLSFDVAVSDDIRTLLRVGSTFEMAEGRIPIAIAEVRRILD